ncbi:MAG: adenylate/guanylate cyclase domain-containing protein [Oligoflexia bacterium]|nr:adenylate/guanylate cyclase domain-containing protein [Oligoflexia bacterium]
MLKLTPFRIVAFLTLVFSALLFSEHLTYTLMGDNHEIRSLQAMSSSDSGDIRISSDSIPLLSWILRNDYDLHMRRQQESKPHPDVLIVDISEKSIREIGQFPFSRRVYGEFIERMNEYSASSVAFDLTFPEAEGGEALTVLRQIQNETKDNSAVNNIIEQKILEKSGDYYLAKALKETKVPIILGATFSDLVGEDAFSKVLSNADNSLKKEIEQSIGLVNKSSLRRVQVSDMAAIPDMETHFPVFPHLELLRAGNKNVKTGFFIAAPDDDSVIRRPPSVISYKGNILGSLAVWSAANYLGSNPELNGEDGSLKIRYEKNGQYTYTPLTPYGSSYARYYGKERTFPYVEFSDVLSRRVDPKTFHNKVILLGVTASGLKDIRANPFSKDFPGVEVHATIISNILKNEFLEKDHRFYFIGYAFVLFASAIVGAAVFFLQPAWSIPVALLVIAAIQYLCQYFFDRGIVVPSIIPSISAISVMFFGTLVRYFSEAKEKKVIRNAFSRYVSNDVINEILKDHSKLRLGGQKKVLTVMFCDLVGFTKLSERMDATFLTQLLNEYFTRMTAIVLANGGTLDKYMGDAIMSFWGAPLDIPNHAHLACKAATEMVAELEKINREWKEKHGIEIDLRIGIHTGEMSVGNLGSEQVFSYTVLGDNVNLASRLEGVNNVYKTRVLISEETQNCLENKFITRHMDCVQVKGKEESINIYELLRYSETAIEKDEWIRTFEEAVRLYAIGSWDEAKATFGLTLKLNERDDASKVFIERIQELEAQNQEAAKWDGVWRLNTK